MAGSARITSAKSISRAPVESPEPPGLSTAWSSTLSTKHQSKCERSYDCDLKALESRIGTVGVGWRGTRDHVCRLRQGETAVGESLSGERNREVQRAAVAGGCHHADSAGPHISKFGPAHGSHRRRRHI